MVGKGAEIIANIDRLNRLMDENDLAAVVARSGRNFTYLTGLAYPGTLARLMDLTDSDRGVMVLWPRQGDPVLVVNATGGRAGGARFLGRAPGPLRSLCRVALCAARRPVAPGRARRRPRRL